MPNFACNNPDGYKTRELSAQINQPANYKRILYYVAVSRPLTCWGPDT